MQQFQFQFRVAHPCDCNYGQLAVSVSDGIIDRHRNESVRLETNKNYSRNILFLTLVDWTNRLRDPIITVVYRFVHPVCLAHASPFGTFFSLFLLLSSSKLSKPKISCTAPLQPPIPLPIPSATKSAIIHHPSPLPIPPVPLE